MTPDRNTYGWAARNASGRIIAMSVRTTRREVIEFVPLIGIGAGEYERLGAKRGYRLAYRRGWRVIRVKVLPFGRQP